VRDQLLGCKVFNLQVANAFAIQIEKDWDYALSYFYDKLETGMYSEIINPIKNTLNLFCKNVTTTLQQLKRYRDENNGRYRRLSVSHKNRI